jgi:L-alanine-DL-glutamate epimerase-like enolase superfamily enzyme
VALLSTSAKQVHRGVAVRPRHVDVPIDHVEVSAYIIPTDYPESDGTLEWQHTTLVLVEAEAGGRRGLGYSYADLGTAHLIQEILIDVVQGHDAMAVPDGWLAMVQAIRNMGRPGVASMAIAAVDAALWDLKARLLNLPLVTLLGRVRDAVPVYGSGGFTSYSIEQLQQQLAGWVHGGIPCVKMKIGRHPKDDVYRVRAARQAIGPDPQLFVDANGAYSRKQALSFAERCAELGVTWFEEPVSSDDLEGLRLLRNRAPAGMDITAGEYGYDLFYFRRMLEAEAVDVLQADGTRCGGITGFLKVGALCEAQPIPLSAHCAPSYHAHVCCATIPVRHIEYFHDHVRIEHLLFDGALVPIDGALHPDLSRPGNGLEFKHKDAERYAV